MEAALCTEALENVYLSYVTSKKCYHSHHNGKLKSQHDQKLYNLKQNEIIMKL
jgi:hypothetical protein